jgi:hypothetical protein
MTNASVWLNLRIWNFAFEKQQRSDVEIISWFYVLPLFVPRAAYPKWSQYLIVK